MEQQKLGSELCLGYADPAVDNLLKHSLRTQLEALSNALVKNEQRQETLQQCFTDTISLVLSQSETSHEKLQRSFIQMYDHAVQSMAQAGLGHDILTRQYIGETGLIMSPMNCRHTIKDIYRIKGFAQGIDRAINQFLKRKDVIHILYPACGPFAPLLLPLLQYYKTNRLFDGTQIKVTLIDVHPGAVAAVTQLIDDLSVSDFIDEVVEHDATKYIPDNAYDLLVLEAMQHGFSQEGQLSIAKHLVQFLTIDGAIIPNKVSVKGMMVIGETEFNTQWREAQYTHSKNMNDAVEKDRVELGEVLSITKDSLLKMEEISLDGGINVIAGNKITIPENVVDMNERIFAVYAHLDVFSDIGIGQYDSGITHPKPDMSFYVDTLPRNIEGAHFSVMGGESVQFYYQLSGLPGFIPTKVQ
mgnify:CR=1 FL=1